MENQHVFLDAISFTHEMTGLTNGAIKARHELSKFASNIIRILNLDVENSMYTYKSLTGKTVVILFAKNTDMGKNSVYRTERVKHEGQDVDIIVLPNDELLDNLDNETILTNLDYVYAFVLDTPKPSVKYVSPIEICKHLYARYFFKYRFFINSFDIDSKTLEELKLDLTRMDADTMVDFETIYRLAGETVSGGGAADNAIQLFEKNDILDYIDASVYYSILEDLQMMAGESEEDEEE